MQVLPLISLLVLFFQKLEFENHHLKVTTRKQVEQIQALYARIQGTEMHPSQEVTGIEPSSGK